MTFDAILKIYEKTNQTVWFTEQMIKTRSFILTIKSVRNIEKTLFQNAIDQID